MKVQGIVSEYNPFHNGHLHQITASAANTGADATVCVMSGNFVQRGEPAAFSKWARAEMALQAGVDLVLELPVAFACASAEMFAAGAISVLEATGIVDFLCFGSETGHLAPLETAARILFDEPAGYRALLRDGLDQGLSFAVARQKALAEWLAGQPETVTSTAASTTTSNSASTSSSTVTSTANILASPNDILGVEYLKALYRIGSRMQPHTVKRCGRGYNDPVLDGTFPSATALRKALSGGGTPEDKAAASGMPATTRAILRREMDAGRGPVSGEQFLNVLLQRLRTAPNNELANLPWMEQGLHHRLRAAAFDASSWDGLVGAAASSRYPRTRIQRMLCALLIGLSNTLLAELAGKGHAQYIRVLGFGGRGRTLLADMRRKASLPLIGRAAQWGLYRDPLIQALLSLECRATDTWVLACREASDKRAGMEQRSSPIMLASEPQRKT